MAKRTRGQNTKSYLAIHDMERLGINPIEYLNEVFLESMKSYRETRKTPNKDDEKPEGMPGAQQYRESGVGYLSVAAKCASDLAKFKHPTLSAIAVKDMNANDGNDGTAMTTIEAVKILQADPFASEQIKQIDSKRVVEAMESTIDKPLLPKGKADLEGK